MDSVAHFNGYYPNVNLSNHRVRKAGVLTKAPSELEHVGIC